MGCDGWLKRGEKITGRLWQDNGLSARRLPPGLSSRDGQNKERMSDAASSVAHDSVNPTKWIALLGRQDKPTDGVEDYCLFLGRALASQGIELEPVRVPWGEIGWIGALRQLSRESSAWRGKWVLLQYTTFMWSRRGFPLGVVVAMTILRRCGARVAIVFHEACRQGGPRWI